MRLKDTHCSPLFLHFSFLIMSLSIALSLLAQGNNGSEILEILDAIAADFTDTQEDADLIQF